MKTNFGRIFSALTLTFGLAFAMPSMAQETGFHVLTDDFQQLQLEFTTGDLTVGEVTLDGQVFSTLTFDGSVPSAAYGCPALPLFSKLIEVPLCDGFDVQVEEAEYDTLKALPHLLMPVQLPRRKSDTSALKLFMNREVYSWNAFLGEGRNNAMVEAVGVARDRNLARLQFAPVRYNPVTGQVVVCRRATVTVTYREANREATLAMFERYHSPAFASNAGVVNNLYPKSVASGAPVRYLIVAHSMFRGHLDQFVDWKRRKGFLTDVVYTDNSAVGTTTTSIQAYIQSQYTGATAANPAPTYVLLVGDVEQIPAFNGNTSNSHITDLYYTTWTSGDMIPDCYHGRFSAQSVDQLMPQIEKTLMYEQYTFADPSFLDRAIMVAGVDGGSAGDHGYTHADPAMDYAITNYINGANGFANVYYFKNNTSIVPTATNVTVSSSASGNAATVRAYYNLGAGWVNYSAHGGSTGWSTPNFGNTHVSAMTNTQKFGLYIGNCCQTNMYGETTCFGEALLRKGNYCGAVGYIGGSDYTYWNEDFYWAVGLRSSISASMSMSYVASNLGAYDRLCHTHGEAFSQWMTSQGAIMMAGNMAVQSSSSSLKDYYWEIYHLMGDPSVMPYLTQAPTMTLTAPSNVIYGTTSVLVSAAPYAYVAMTDTLTHTLVAAAWANASGQATLTLPSTVPVGGYEIAATAQQYQAAFHNLSIIQPVGAFPSVISITPATPLVAGDTVALTVTVENIGSAMARGVNINMTSSSPLLTLPVSTLYLDSLAMGTQHVFSTQVYAVVSPDAPDLTTSTITSTTTWTGTTNPAVSIMPMTLVAPIPLIKYSNQVVNILPGASQSLTVTLQNLGHAALRAYDLQAYTPTALLVASPAVTSAASLAAGDSLNVVVTLQASNSLPQGINVPLCMALRTSAPILADTLQVFIGNGYCETFEGNQYHLSGWTNGTVQWVLYNDVAHTGSYCAGSSYTIGASMTSETSISCTVGAPDSISFYYRVSSEANYDKFHFYIDDTEMFNASGEVNWTRAAYPVTAGTHTFKFTYSKDYSVNSGTDRAWIDDIVLPHSVSQVVFSSDTLCAGDTYVLGGQTVNTDTPGSGSIVTQLANGIQLVADYVVYPSSQAEQFVDACGSYWLEGTEYTTSGDVVLGGTNVYGCDSTTTFHLTIVSVIHNEENIAVCDSLQWNDVVYTSSADIIDSAISTAGCDSITEVHLVVHYSAIDTIRVNTNDLNYTWNDSVYTESGTYQQVFQTVDGCDSTVILLLTFSGGTEGIDDIASVGISVYPNPTSGMLYLSQQVEEVMLYDMVGRMVMSRRDVKALDLGSLPPGVYTLRVDERLFRIVRR